MQGAVTFIRGARSKRVPIYHVTNLPALATFAGQIETYSNAGIRKVSTTEVQDLEASQDPTYHEYDGYYAVFQFKNTAPAEGDNPYQRFHLPDPPASIMEDVDGKMCVIESVGDTVAGWFSTLTGKSFEFDKGWLWQG